MPNSAFRPITPRVGDFNYLSSQLPPAVASLAFQSEDGTATLCGLSEYASPSSPPKKYRLQTLSGFWHFCSWNAAGGGTCNDPIGVDQKDKHVYSGTYSYGSLTCAQINAQLATYYFEGLNSQPCDDNIPFSSTSVPAEAFVPDFLPVGHYTPTVGQVAKSWVYDDTCYSNGGFGSKASGTITAALTVEDTETDAIVRSTPSGSGVSAVSYRETRGAGDFSFLWQNSSLVGTASALVSGQDYQITADILTETYGGGSPVVSQLVYLFTASGPTEPIDIPIPCAPGKQVTASNPAVIAG